jgi:hypothetical protein
MADLTAMLQAAAGAGGEKNYIEDVFSTFLYTGNGSTQTITNDIDLSTKGGMVWIKCRNTAYGHRVNDTVRGASKFLATNSTAAEDTNASVLTAFTSSGFSVGASTAVNENAATYASWAFREQPKFFDVVTYTGNGSGSDQTINHNLGSTPGCIIVKATNASQDWLVWHRATSSPNDKLFLNLTDAVLSGYGNGVQSVTSASFRAAGNTTVNNPNYDININGRTYVAYIFAHNAGGFGLTGTDNVISCGSFSGNTTVTLGYEPQWILLKRTDAIGNWDMHDVMRGWPTSGDAARLRANLSDAETETAQIFPNATGFSTSIGSGDYIYIAIRRGPMKVPTVGTNVFAPITTTGTDNNSRVITGVGFSPDLIISCTRGSSALDRYTQDRLRGLTKTIYTNTSGGEQTGQGIYAVGTLNMSGFTLGTSSGVGFNNDSDTYVFECFKRAPSFFDEVCYTGTGSATTFSHNLAVVPELMIVKGRTGTRGWRVYFGVNTKAAELNSTGSADTNSVFWNNTSPTSSVFTVGTDSDVNTSAVNYVAYLFATCAGVSKVGSYTGTGTTLQINCGFTGGSRFVMIKRTDSTGDWYVWDSARGIVAGNDPYLLLNTTAAEVTNTDYVDTYSAGFEISSTAPAAINASGGTFIFLAIA